MAKAIATMLGLLLGGHGIVNLFVEGELLLGMFNADAALDVVYLVSAVVLLAAGMETASDRSTTLVLAVVGIVCAAFGALGLVDDTIGGILPTGLTPPDLILFFAVAGACLLTVALPSTRRPLEWPDGPLE